jgi:2-phospho-L-lactate guanylyltransferase (CobY/MobA/RfbA family)
MRRPIRPAFGPSSALHHAAQARTLGMRASVLDLPGFALDVDDEAALAATAYTRP